MANAGRISAGRLRHRITIRRNAMVDDGLGGQTPSWATIAQVWAEVEGIDGRESMMAHALQGVSNYRITIRTLPSLLDSDQIVLSDGAELNIKSVSDPDGRRIQLQILAESGSVQADAG